MSWLFRPWTCSELVIHLLVANSGAWQIPHLSLAPRWCDVHSSRDVEDTRPAELDREVNVNVLLTPLLTWCGKMMFNKILMAEQFYILKDRFKPLWRGTPHPLHIDATLNKRHCNNKDFKSSQIMWKTLSFINANGFFPCLCYLRT